jgi:hypothetical protein
MISAIIYDLHLPGVASPRHQKRGVLLLVVLSLLTLFMLLGTTYMVVTSRARATARAFARASEAAHSAQSAAGRRFVDEAFLAVARGPANHEDANANGVLDAGEDRNGNNKMDPIGFPVGEDLLGDKYGFADRQASQANRVLLTGMITSGTVVDASRSLVVVPVTTWNPASVAPETLAGRVLTFTLPDFTWSTRILRARGTNGGATTGLVVSLAPVAGSRGVNLADLNAAIARAPAGAGASSHFMINTREFTGKVGTLPPGTIADTNEPYDGFDDANPFLAQILQSPPFSSTASGTIASGSCARFSYAPTPANQQPIDNDGDGVPDSYWLDFGFPVIHDSAGDAFKARAAVLVVDLDGRLNVNAHGSPAELDLLETGLAQNAKVFQWPSAAPELPSSLTSAKFAALPIGSGYGPAEVRLRDLLLVGSDTATAAATLKMLFSGTALVANASSQPQGWKRPLVSATNAWGRYGDAGLNPQPGVSGSDDALSTIQDQQRARTTDGNPARRRSLCNDWRMNTTFPKWQADPDSYISPPDLSGRMKVFADRQPPTDGVVARMRYAKPVVSGSHWWQGDTSDDPYEIRLDRRSAADATFGPDELERILRIYDWDTAQLPSRLAALLGRDAERLRLLLTSESWDTTAIIGEAWAKIEAALQATPSTQWAKVFAPELIAGRRLDINRPVQTDAEKQLLCRQLYTLLWALLDKTTDPGALEAAAQWAANVVDFRDSDSAMTRFAYDINPKDGWSAGADVVWGLERPELLINEALAWQSDGGADGGVYVSLHHPWSAKAIDGDTFSPDGEDSPAWIDPDAVDPSLGVPPAPPKNVPLNLLNLDARGGGDQSSPVWRLRIANQIARLDAPPGDEAATGEFWSKPQNTGTNRQIPPDGSICIFSQSKKPAATDGTVDIDGAFPSTAQLAIDMQGSTAASLKPGNAASITVILERLADPSKKYASDTNEYLEVDRIEGVKVVDRTPDQTTKAPREAYVKNTRRINATSPGSFWKRVFDAAAAGSPNASITLDKPKASPRVACMPWLNRPYLSVAELALVPPWNSAAFLEQYSGLNVNGMLGVLTARLNQQPGFLANLFETTSVPSRFTGLATTVDEDTSGQNPLRVSSPDCDPGLDMLPVNQFASYREPGRVNLNTVSDQRVWEAAVLRGPRPADVSTVGNAALDWSSSTLGRTGTSGQPAKTALQMLTLKGGSTSTVMVADTDDPGPDPAGNPQFLFLTANRLANVATTRSHVFAVWVTVGFFDPVTGMELGADTGDVKRHRGFYIFDRSIPVAYETGKDHNVRDAILLRRIIQ